MRHAMSIMADDSLTNFGRPKRLASARIPNAHIYAKQEIRKKLKQVSNILKKKESDRSEAEKHVLNQAPDVVKTAEKNAKRLLKQKERVQEVEDDPEALDSKCQELARMIQTSNYTVIYTGAGISTAASIPDYRGPNGVWTLLRKGQSLSPQDLVEADPTYTHMCITKLFREGKVKYVVSQNCDGLHLRSGFPRHSLSEVHGNMFIEICRSCKPHKEYIRLFDVTERTAKGRHKTGRTCSKCGGNLYDTIVHFGEKGGLKSPYKWRQAAKAAAKADLILCLGSSLKVLRCYPCLWGMDKRPQHRPRLAIVNLQWTPKDDSASLKINGRCDDVMRKVAGYLSLAVPTYYRETDPLFRLNTPVGKNEELIASKKILEVPDKTSKVKSKPPHRTKPGVKQAEQEVTHPQPPPQKPQRTFSVIQRLNKAGDITDDGIAELLGLASKQERSSADHRSQETDVSGREKKSRSHPMKRPITEFHLNDPVRQKLEKLLEERGAKDKYSKHENGVLQHTNDASHHAYSGAGQQTSQSNLPLPGFHSFLPGGSQVEPPPRYPQLRSLLGTCLSQVPPVAIDHDVFRVDLSTDPISITSSCSAAKLEGASADTVTLNISLDKSHPDCSMTSDAPVYSAAYPACSSSTVPESNYAKLMRNITFDHSYAKSSTRSHSSSKRLPGENRRTTPGNSLSLEKSDIVSVTSDSISCTLALSAVSARVQEALSSYSQYSQQPVIPLLSSIDSLSAQNNHQLFSHQELVHVVQQVMDSLPSGADFLRGHFNPVPTVQLASDGVNSDGHDYGQSERTASFSAAHKVSNACKPSPVVNPWAVDTEQGGSSQAPDSMECGEDQGEEDEASSESSGRSKNQNTSASVPGWFGKGLKVRRRRNP